MAKKQSPSTLLWFIRRKSYIPICEIRRRFAIESEDGAFLEGADGERIFVGLPANTAGAIEKLWRQGKIGLELSVEFDCQVLIGVYPMVPVREEAATGHKRDNVVHLVQDVTEEEPPISLAAGE